MAATLSDEILIEQARNGRQTAFAMLVKRYEQYAFTLAFRFVKNREDAHEVAQDAFLRAFRYLPDFRGDAKFSTWLYKIVYSTALNFLRKQHPEILSTDDENRPVRLPDEGMPDASQAMERNDRNAALQRAIQMLSPDDAGIITLFYLYEHSLEEICQITEMTMTNAKTKLCRARQRLKNIVEDRFSAEIAY
ncbi:MAG: sigma-70 family RNA polymerase sigma factor [Bacteroidetes bacterium]|nr:sigma-70 family RNA polymerase sigma factor [Bacteroidota bacterium]